MLILFSLGGILMLILNSDERECWPTVTFSSPQMTNLNSLHQSYLHWCTAIFMTGVEQFDSVIILATESSQIVQNRFVHNLDTKFLTHIFS